MLVKKPKDRFTAADFHRLRIELKKAYAVFLLTGHYSKKFRPKKSFADLKSLFDVAGEVREFQILQSWIRENYPGFPLKRFYQYLRSATCQKMGVFFHMRRELSKRKFPGDDFEVLRKIAHHIGNKQIKSYLKLVTSKIKRQAESKKTDAANLHHIRKLIKTYGYLSSLQPAGNDEPVLFNTGKPARRLGDWHDWHANSTIMAQMSGEDFFPAAEIKMLQFIATKSKRRAEKLGDQLAAGLRKMT